MDFNEFFKLVKNSRSIRRFKSDQEISEATLKKLVETSCYTPSSRNRQPLKYVIVSEKERRDDVFSCLNWAKALKTWEGPTKDQRPGGYIIILGDTSLVQDKPGAASARYSVDHGITSQTIMLAANTMGYGGCILASVDRVLLREKLRIDNRYDILLVLALGVPDEKVQIEPMPENGSVSYWRDVEDIHHVPKRDVDELIVDSFCESSL